MIVISTRRGIEALDEYDSIICNRRNSQLPDDEYGEVHHVLPRSLGGGDDCENLVRLTPEEHYRCHELLPLIYEDGEEHWKMLFAWHTMVHTRQGVAVDAELYGVLRRWYSKAVSEKHKGKPFSDEHKRKLSEAHKGKHLSEEHKMKLLEINTGRHHSEEARRKISEANRGKPLSDEHKRKLSEAHKGKTHSHSEETRRKISVANKGKTPWIKGKHLSEGHKRKISEASKRWWANRRNTLCPVQ